MEHEYITSKELNLVYGNKGDFEGAGKLREEIRKVVCRHSIELDSKLFNNIQKEYSKHKDWGCKGYIDKNYFLKELEKTDVWNDGLEKEFRKNDFYFVHPVYFLSHLNRAGIITINPYNGLSYEKIHGGDIGKNVDKTKIVTDNPGFASVWSNTGKAPNHNINGFAAITGFFNEDYAGLKGYEKAKHYYHEGVDFRGIEGKTEIVSLIYGTVLAYGRLEKYGRVIFVSDDNSNGLYLLAHLKYYNKTLLDNKVIRPGDIVGYVGTSGEGTSEQDCDGKYDSHLHVTYFVNIDKRKVYVIKNGDRIDITTNYDTNFKNKKRNPFIHDSEPKGNND